MARGGSRFFSVAKGRQTGVFRTWEECKAHVNGFSGAKFKSFSTEAEAMQYLHVEGSEHRASAKRDASPPMPLDFPRAAAIKVPSPSLPKAPTPPASSHRGTLPYDMPTQRVYVDGSCLANGQGAAARGGYGCYYGHNDPRNVSAPLSQSEKQTNNRGELRAVLHAVQTATRDRSAAALDIHTDSKYCIDGATTWQAGWKARGYSGVQNADLWKELDIALQQRRKQFTDDTGLPGELAVQFTHVRGHTGVHGNEMADRLAVLGSQQSGRFGK